MLEFLVTEFPDRAHSVLQLQTDPRQDSEYVHRERRRLDLELAVPGYRPVVLENKLSSYPDSAQLQRYASDKAGISSANLDLVLLSVMDPPVEDGTGATWTHLSYGELGRRLARAFRSATEFSEELMAHWGQLCSTLQRLADAVGLGHDPDQPFFMTLPWGLEVHGDVVYDLDVVPALQ